MKSATLFKKPQNSNMNSVTSPQALQVSNHHNTQISTNFLGSNQRPPQVLIDSVAEDVRLLMVRHLQQHTWTESAYTLDNIQSPRWHLGSCGKSEGQWKAILTVTKAKQAYFIQRIHFMYQVRRRQTRAATHARVNGEQWDATLEGTCFLLWVLDAMTAARTDDGSEALFMPAVAQAAAQKILEGPLSSMKG